MTASWLNKRPILRSQDYDFDKSRTYVYTILANYQGHGSVSTSHYQITGQLEVKLSSTPFDFAYDSTRNLIYVSLPNENCIAVISSLTWNLVNKVVVGSRPYGIDISHDFSKLFIALYSHYGTVVNLDLNTYNMVYYDEDGFLGSQVAYDVIEALPNRIFITGGPYLAVVKTDEVRGARVPIAPAISDFLTQQSVFQTGVYDTLLYLVKSGQIGIVNLNDTAYTIVDRFSIEAGDVRQDAESPDGSRLYLPGGSVVSLTSRSEIYHLPRGGLPVLDLTGSRLYMGRGYTKDRYGRIVDGRGLITSYDVTNFTLVDSIVTDMVDIYKTQMMPGDSIILFLTGKDVRGVNINSIKPN